MLGTSLEHGVLNSDLSFPYDQSFSTFLSVGTDMVL